MTTAPNGYFSEDLMVFGGLREGGVAAKGFVLQPPNLVGAPVERVLAYRDKIRTLLNSLSLGMSAQFQWTCDAAFGTGPDDPPGNTNQGRHEELVVFVTAEIALAEGGRQASGGLARHYAQLFAALREKFEVFTQTMRAIFGSETSITAMSDHAYFVYLTKFLNPSLADRSASDLAGRFNPALSLHTNCWDPASASFSPAGLQLDGAQHAIFALKTWPRRIYPGMGRCLTDLPFAGYRITVNATLLPAHIEAEKERQAIQRLGDEYAASKRRSLLLAIGRREEKIEALSSGTSRPFAATWVIRAWEQPEAPLAIKSPAIREAIKLMGGAVPYECAHATTARKLFFSSWPGWTRSPYEHRSLSADDFSLSNMLPFPASPPGPLPAAG